MTEDEILTEDARRAYQIASAISVRSDERATLAAGILQAMAINRLTQMLQDREE